jgi:hypothetical protein
MLFKLGWPFNSIFAVAVLILSFMNVFVLAILFYLLFRFIGGFLIPLFRTTRHMRQQFHNMDGKPPGGGQSGNPTTPGKGSSEQAEAPKSSSTKGGEYIDFEEVK